MKYELRQLLLAVLVTVGLGDGSVCTAVAVGDGELEGEGEGELVGLALVVGEAVGLLVGEAGGAVLQTTTPFLNVHNGLIISAAKA